MIKKLCLIAALIAGASGGRFFLTNQSSVKSNSEIYRINSEIFADTLLIPDPQIESIYLYLVFPSGEAVNPFDEGLAHYVEHLTWLSAFGSADDRKKRHSNAWTGMFSTGYWQVTIIDKLQSALQTLISVSMPLSLDAAFALEERNIILREYDYRVAERPMYPVYQDMNKILYGDGTMARSVIGEPSTIAAYALDTARKLHQKSHVLHKASLLAYGNVNRAQLRAALDTLPTEERAGPEINSVAHGLVEDGVVEDRDSLSMVKLSEDKLLYGKVVPFDYCDDPVHCALLRQIVEKALKSTLPGGLAGPLRFDQFVARSFSFDIWFVGNTHVEISFTAHPDDGVSLEDLEVIFQNNFQTTLENGLPDETFERIRSRLKDKLNDILGLDRPSHNRKIALGQLRSAQPIFTLLDQIHAVEHVRLEDVNQFLRSLRASGREVTRLVTAER